MFAADPGARPGERRDCFRSRALPSLAIAMPRTRSSARAEADDLVRVNPIVGSASRCDPESPEERLKSTLVLAALQQALQREATTARRNSTSLQMAQRDDVVGVTARGVIRQRLRFADKCFAIRVLSGRTMPMATKQSPGSGTIRAAARGRFRLVPNAPDPAAGEVPLLHSASGRSSAAPLLCDDRRRAARRVTALARRGMAAVR